jgi:hypothetical protein
MYGLSSKDEEDSVVERDKEALLLRVSTKSHPNSD